MIIDSILDLDFYKLTQGQVAFDIFPTTKVKYAFTNRSKQYKLADIIDKQILTQELEFIRTLKLTEEEGVYLKTLKIFSDDYIDFLKNIELPELHIDTIDGQFIIEVSGYWREAILWETLILSVINELYYKSKYQDHSKLIEYGTNRNMAKYSTLSNNPDVNFTDFGTRRRFSKKWQEDVVSIMKSLPGFSGTSNVKLAMKYNLKPVGTNAHELQMVATGIWNNDIRRSYIKMLDIWYERYGSDLSIALTDTFGTKSFFEDFTEEMAKKWVGLRHDSGCPFEFGENAIKFYESKNIDPKSKMLVFSDGLTLDLILKLYSHFNGKIKISFGWGTHLTNDMGVETLSIVMKAVEVISRDNIDMNNKLVKLSDNLNKAIGPDDQIERFKKIFGYTNTDREETIV